MTGPLFSTYRAGENRVTGSTLAVFERIGLTLAAELLAAATGGDLELSPVAFVNQVVAEDSVPDARIGAHFDWWFETKTERNVYADEGHGRRQLRHHAQLLRDDRTARLFVLTPDMSAPPWLDPVDGLDGVDPDLREQISWVGFRRLADVITTTVSDPTRLLGEQTRMLLAELVALYEADGLTTTDDVVIVAARTAWPEYERRSAYICQARRSFKTDLTHMAFYASGAVQPTVARIQQHHTAVPWTADEAADRDEHGEHRLAELIRTSLDEGDRSDGEAYDVWFLSGPGDPDTVTLKAPIANDTVTAAGKPWAYTLGQRYARLDRLQAARTTSAI